MNMPLMIFGGLLAVILILSPIGCWMCLSAIRKILEADAKSRAAEHLRIERAIRALGSGE